MRASEPTAEERARTVAHEAYMAEECRSVERVALEQIRAATKPLRARVEELEDAAKYARVELGGFFQEEPYRQERFASMFKALHLLTAALANPQPPQAQPAEPTDEERMDWLEERLWFHMPDSGLPGRWTLDFADQTGRDEEGGTFSIRAAIDAALRRERGEDGA